MGTSGFKALLAAALVGSSLSLGVVGTADAAAPLLSIHVYCSANAERTVVHNNKGYALTIKQVGSIYRPHSGEPFQVNRLIGAHKSITFYSGSRAKTTNKNTLTRQFIYSNNVGTREGARVRTTNGHSYSDRC
jgi:hypothetical protein